MPSGKKINWNQYNNLIERELPNYTIKEFVRKFLPEISDKAVGTRARKLGIKPAQYQKTKEERKKLALAITKETPEIVSYIKENIDIKNRKEMSQHLGISYATLARIINKNNIKLSEYGKMRAHESSRLKNLGKKPWNLGKKLPPEIIEKMAAGRQKQSGRLSRIQATLYRILDEFNIKYFTEQDEECHLGPWTFDCRIGDTLVEVNGDYIHNLPKNQPKDKAKKTYVERYYPNLKIEYIWEHEFGAINRVKSRINKILNINPELIDFQFTNLNIKQIDTKEAKNFLDAFHYIGFVSSKFYLGAYLEDKLIAVSVWGAPHRSEIAHKQGVTWFECFELKRFAIHDCYHKRNFASWFLGKCEKMIPDKIRVLVSFADPSFGHEGTIYKACNWKFDGETSGSYFYLDSDGYPMHKKTLFNHAHKMHMKELEFASKYNYKKVPVSKKLRYVKFL